MTAYIFVKCMDCGWEWGETEDRMNIVVTHPLCCSKCGCVEVEEVEEI